MRRTCKSRVIAALRIEVCILMGTRLSSLQYSHTSLGCYGGPPFCFARLGYVLTLLPVIIR